MERDFICWWMLVIEIVKWRKILMVVNIIVLFVCWSWFLRMFIMLNDLFEFDGMYFEIIFKIKYWVYLVKFFILCYNVFLELVLG